jgi:hypothetical protein
MSTTKVYDLCLAWNWEYDADFVAMVETASRAHEVSFVQITPGTLAGTLVALQQGQLACRVLLDRASDSDERFLALVQWARENRVRRLNPYERARRAWDKAAMHRTLGAALHTLPTIILPPYAEQPNLPALDLAPLGEYFSIKPAHGGGGVGVVCGATSIAQALVARQEYPDDRYLLQSYIVPVQLGGRPAWFRTIYCAGKIFLCWWDMQTHVYTPVGLEEEEGHGLGLLRTIVAAIAYFCGLDLFSSETALSPDGRFIVIDYVNDPLDLRLQSRTLEGVPDLIVQAIAEALVVLAAGSGREQGTRSK